MEKKMLVEGMKCVHCKASVEKALKSVPGVQDADADLETKTVRILLENEIPDSMLMDAVKENGFTPVKMF